MAEDVCVFNDHGTNASLYFLSALDCENAMGDHRRTYSMPEVDVTTANTGALDIEKNLSWLQVSTSLHFLQTRFRLRDPKIVRGVRVNTNVRLG